MDKLNERFLFISRRFRVPMYLGLVGALIILIYKFSVEFVSVAIAAIDLLLAFINVREYTSQDPAWKVAIPFIFMVSGVLFALPDRIAAQAKLLENELGSDSRADRHPLRPQSFKSHSELR